MPDEKDKSEKTDANEAQAVNAAVTPGMVRVPGWTSAYYAGWRQGFNNDGYLRAEQIDYSALTHVIHFVVKPAPRPNNGALDLRDTHRLLTVANSTALLSAAHAAGVKVVFSLGGNETIQDFMDATSAANRANLVNNLVKFMTNNGAGYGGHNYDGIDIDWEPMDYAAHRPLYNPFITALRQRLNTITPRPLLTASAVGYAPQIYGELHANFDQVNIMTYVMAGPWNGRVWFNSAIYGSTPPDQCIDTYLQGFLNAGVPARKLGIAITFYGQQWSGVTQPRQTYPMATPPATTPPPPPFLRDIPYSDIMSCYYDASRYHWDEAAQAAYLSISGSTLVKDGFISYDNEESVKRKIDYMRAKGLGGIILWELSEGWRPGRTPPDPLLRAFKNASVEVPGSAA